MANFYADRVSAVYAGIPLDGFEFSSFNFDVDIGLEFVDTMSDDYSTGGFLRGNTKVTGSFTLKILSQGSLPELEAINPQTEDISLIVTIASTQFNPVQFQGTSWIIGGVVVSSTHTTFSGPASVGERSYTFKATRYTPVPPAV
jgi:hypothetical protein